MKNEKQGQMTEFKEIGGNEFKDFISTLLALILTIIHPNSKFSSKPNLTLLL